MNWFLVLLIFTNDPTTEPKYVYKTTSSLSECQSKLVKAELLALETRLRVPDIRFYGECLPIEK